MLKQYIRDKNNNPIGLMLADMINGEMEMGYSLCCKKDTYNKAKGLAIAMHRLQYTGPLNHVPHSIQNQLDWFEVRAMKYYKIPVEVADA